MIKGRLRYLHASFECIWKKIVNEKQFPDILKLADVQKRR